MGFIDFFLLPKNVKKGKGLTEVTEVVKILTVTKLSGIKVN